MVYCPHATEDVNERPMAQKIQPMVFLGCREATIAPIVVNNTKTSKPQTSRSNAGWLTAVGVGEFRNLNNAHTLTNVRERAHKNQRSQTVGRRLLPTTPSTRSLAFSVTTLLYRITASRTIRRPLRGRSLVQERRERPRTPYPRTSENPINAKFAEFPSAHPGE